MRPLTSTVTTSFAGHVDLGNRQVPVVVSVVDDVVSLLVAGDSIGSWPAAEIEFIAAGDRSYVVHADGDSLTFHPAEPDSFALYLAGEAATTSPDRNAYPPGSELSAPAVHPARESRPDAHHPSPQLEALPPTREEQLVVWDEPDEYFAAGLSGPPGDTTAVPSVRFNRIPVPVSQEHPPTQGGPAPGVPVEQSSGESDRMSSRDRDDEWKPETTAGPELENGQPDPLEIATVFDEQLDAPIPDSPATTDAAATVPSPPVPSPPRRRRRAKAPVSDPDAEVEGDGDEEAEIATSEDKENLRQWAVVAGAGVVGLVLLGTVAWAVTGLVGEAGTESPPPTPSETTVATTVVAPVPEPPPPTVAPTEVDPQQFAAASAFITEWNSLARTYASHMAISGGETLPVESAITSTIHLAYSGDSLTLNALPKGERSDRDILVAMGLAVAWAEPSLSPNGRRDVLGSLGIDIDDPQLDTAGGDVRRGDVHYEASVVDQVLRFTVTR